LNNIIFKKKNLKNNFYSNYDKRHNKNSSTVENSQFEIMSKNDTTSHEDGKSYEESYDDTQNSIQTLPSNKSLRQFYSRHPRKMNRTKTKRRKLNESKREEKKERSRYEKLKREKSEIIHSLTILLKKKEQIKNDENRKKEINDNDSGNEDNYKNKTIDSDNRKKIFVNKIKNDELKRIILNENRRNRKESLKNNNEGEDYEKDEFRINNNEQRKIIFVKQNEDLIQKGDNYTRSRYNNRRHRISTNF
jgi:hypothetical protein